MLDDFKSWETPRSSKNWALSKLRSNSPKKKSPQSISWILRTRSGAPLDHGHPRAPGSHFVGSVICDSSKTWCKMCFWRNCTRWSCLFNFMPPDFDDFWLTCVVSICFDVVVWSKLPHTFQDPWWRFWAHDMPTRQAGESFDSVSSKVWKHFGFAEILKWPKCLFVRFLIFVLRLKLPMHPMTHCDWLCANIAPFVLRKTLRWRLGRTQRESWWIWCAQPLKMDNKQ